MEELKALLRYHQREAKFERHCASQMCTIKWRRKSNRRARKHERWVELILSLTTEKGD